MYAAFIRSRTRQAFADLSHGRIERHIERFHEHARLSVHRDGKAVVLEGRAAILDGLRQEFASPRRSAFELADILVDGWPHCTRVAVLWHDRAVVGSRCRVGMNRIVIEWGRVVEEHLFVGGLEAPHAAER